MGPIWATIWAPYEQPIWDPYDTVFVQLFHMGPMWVPRYYPHFLKLSIKYQVLEVNEKTTYGKTNTIPSRKKLSTQEDTDKNITSMWM